MDARNNANTSQTRVASTSKAIPPTETVSRSISSLWSLFAKVHCLKSPYEHVLLGQHAYRHVAAAHTLRKMAYVGPQYGVAPPPSVRASQSGAPSWLETATYTVFEFSGIPLRLHGAHCPGLCPRARGHGLSAAEALIKVCPPHARVHAASFLIFLGVKTFIGACVSRERRARDHENADSGRAASSRRALVG